MLARERPKQYSNRELSCAICISASAVADSLQNLERKALIRRDGPYTEINERGIEALEPYRVKRAVILAAGFGSRMMPATKDRPKPMVRVHGKRIIDTLLDALIAAGVTDITVVGGYRFDKLTELWRKYPDLHLIENTEYSSSNNISSAVLASGSLQGGCYLCEADLLIENPKIISPYQYTSNILGSWSLETDDWCFQMKDGLAADYKEGGRSCYTYYGVSYWTDEDCAKLREDFASVYNESTGGKDCFWEFVPLVLKKDRYAVEIRPCSKSDILEIDSYQELKELDPAYP